jgi:predicted DCC family thiol-disulfide oxidoreductase YuxK
MTQLSVGYDARCGLCTAVAAWIGRQAQLVPVVCHASPHAGEVVVTADTGEVWRGDDAWLVILWALADYRHWSYRLAMPALRPTARTFFATVSKYRGTLSCALGLEPRGSAPATGR